MLSWEIYTCIPQNPGMKRLGHSHITRLILETWEASELQCYLHFCLSMKSVAFRASSIDIMSFYSHWRDTWHAIHCLFQFLVVRIIPPVPASLQDWTQACGFILSDSKTLRQKSIPTYGMQPGGRGLQGIKMVRGWTVFHEPSVFLSPWFPPDASSSIFFLAFFL